MIHAQVALPGLRGVLYSRPCAGATGGDIHYLSVCGSGLMARVCLADVAGHGSAVAAVGTEMHAHLRRSVDVIDERKVLGRLNRRLNERGVGVMTTAVLATYYPPRRRLTVSYAGHPTGWLFGADTGSWAPLCVPVPPPRKPGLVDLPMGIGFTPTYSRHRFRVSPGDRMLLFTDGVLETTSPDDTPFDTDRIEKLLNNRGTGSCEDLACRLLAALHGRCGVRRTGTRRRDVSARGIRRRPSGARLVACLQASPVAPGAAVTRLPRSSWRRHHRDERLGTRRSLYRTGTSGERRAARSPGARCHDRDRSPPALIGLGTILTASTLVWMISVRLEDASIADICWGLGFVLLAWLYRLLSPTLTPRSWLVAVRSHHAHASARLTGRVHRLAGDRAHVGGGDFIPDI